MTLPTSRRALALPTALLCLLSACSSDDNGGVTIPPPAAVALGDLISGITPTGVNGTVLLQPGSAPAGSAAGAALTYSGGGTVAQGSTAQAQLASTEAFEALIVRLAGVEGYYEIDLATAQTVVDLLISLSATAPGGTVDCVYQGRRVGDTEFGQPVVVPVQVLEVGNGELQINLTWTSDADLDLHVFEPSGEEIFYGNRMSATGGELDLDANVGCGNVGVENIFWNQMPPVGEFRVAVNNFSECSQPSSEFVVTVTIPGQPPMVFNGSITEAEGLVDITMFTL